MKDRKLLFFDIDGTLLSEKTHTVPQSAKEALKKAKENGHLIFINTGRPISTIDQEIHDLNPDGYICGCGTYITYHDKVIYHHQLSKERCKEIASLIKKYEIDAVLESKDHVYFNTHIKNSFVQGIQERYTNNGFNVALMAGTGKNLPDFIMSILTPAISGVDNIWMFMGIYLFSNILWLFGINGSSIVFPIVFALCIANTGVNAELVNAGKAPTAIINLQMFRYVLIGGAGNTLGLVLLMCKSKSKHIRSIGRLSVLPGICGINEPIIFGTPIVLNPILSIPFLIMPCLSAGLGYLVQSMGLVSLGYIVDPSFTPFFAQGFLSALDIRNVIFMFVLIAISVVVYYPFFKVYEKNTLEHEGE